MTPSPNQIMEVNAGGQHQWSQRTRGTTRVAFFQRSMKRGIQIVLLLVTILALTSQARGQGSIVYSPFTPTGPGDWQYWDVNQDGTVDFILIQSWLITQDVPPSEMAYSFGIRPSAGNGVFGVGSSVSVLPADAEISLTPTPPGGWLQSSPYGSLLVGTWTAHLREETWSGWNGPMADVPEGYLGLRFLAADGYHLGWLRVHRGGDGMPATIVPVDFAWATQADQPLFAGVVPEPASAALLALALGFLNTLRGRRFPG